MPFNPNQLTVTAGLNRVIIVDLPGVALEASVKGKSAYELLSAQALADYLQERAELLGLPAAHADALHLPILFDCCFESNDGNIRAAAEQVARQFGRHLGYLILTLKRGDAVNRRARTNWDDTYWAYWASIHRVWLGGGLVSGHLGPRLLQYAQATLVEAGIVDCTLHLSSYSSMLPLIGAARCVPSESQAALVFDFGGSHVKRGCAFYESGTLTTLRPFSTVSAQWSMAMHNLVGEARALSERMITVMAETWQAAQASGLTLAPVLVASLACYIADGHPSDSGGVCTELHTMTNHLGRWLSQNVSDRLGRSVEIELVHDGTVAARTYAGETHAAVIMMGTALGVGFPSSCEGLRPISSHFQVLDMQV